MSIFDNPTYERSYELANREIAGRMSGKNSALDHKHNSSKLRNNLNDMLQSIALKFKPDDAVRKAISTTAIEFIPYGSVNGEACFPPGEPPFILIDTGTVDFIGNNAAIFACLLEDEPIFSDDEILDYLFASALIYFERDEKWESRRHAIFAPKLNYSMIPPNLAIKAMGHARSFLLFIVLHELAHVINDPKELEEVDPWLMASRVTGVEVPTELSLQFEECAADYIANDLIIRFSTYCVPEPKMAINILSGVDIGLTFMNFFQCAFPGKQYSEKIIQVNEHMDHPAAFQRIQLYHAQVEEEMKEFSNYLGIDFLAEARKCEKLVFHYNEYIRNGATPSKMFYHKLQLAMQYLQ